MFSITIDAEVFSFENSGLTDWEEESFSGYTRYRLIQDNNKTVVHALADASASGLFNKRAIDIRQTPLINWSWKIKQHGLDNDEKSKSGDDYPARLYVIVKGEPNFGSNYILVYVWSNRAEVDTTWENPYATEFRHLAVETGGKNTDQWRSYSRNVVEDFDRVFGFKPKIVDGIAIMTDGDNSKQKFEAWYGDITFIKANSDG